MKLKKSVRPSIRRPGITLLELSVAIMVLIALISVLFVGMKAYKSGSDRAACVMNIYNVQNAVRSYSNLNGLAAGQNLRTGQSLQSDLVGEAGYVERLPACPAGGTYASVENRIPDHGELFLSCSLAGDERHVPATTRAW